MKKIVIVLRENALQKEEEPAATEKQSQGP